MADAHLSLSFPWWYTSLCILTGVVFAVLMYRRFDFDHPWSKWARPLLFILRTLSVAIICFLLLDPVLKHIRYDEIKPTIVIGVDQSQSVGFALGNNQKAITEKVEALSRELGGTYNVVTQSIGHDIDSKITEQYDRSSTNLNRFFQNINEGTASQAPGAVILLSDGIFNTGPSPLFEASRIKAPVYTLGVGDTLPAKDVSIRNIIQNEIGFLGDISRIQVDIQAFNLKGHSSTVTISQQGQSLQSKPVTISDNDYFTTLDFQIPLNKAGLQKYVITVSQLPGEVTLANNTKEFFIDVLDSKLNIDLIAASPHPDISAIRYVIDENKNYDLKIHYLYEAVQLRDKCDLLILYQVPTVNAFNSSFENLWKNIQNRPIPTLFVLGGQSNLPRFNQIQQTLQVSGSQASMNDVYGIFQPNFPVFTVEDSWKTALPALPPLQLPFGNFVAGANAHILMNQKIGRVETKYPLWLIGQENNKRTGVIAGEGLWRWRMGESARTGRTEVFNDILGNTIRYLATREDKRKFKVRTDERTYEITDNIVITGELYNDNYQLVNDAEVRLVITDPGKKEFRYILDRTDNAYKLDIGQLPAGTYNYSAKVNFQGKELTSGGSFTVKAAEKELFDLVADFGLLRQISDDSGGKFLRVDEIDRLTSLIRSNEAIKPVIKSDRKTDPLINLKWIFGLLALLLTAEWLLRRYMGRY